MCLLISWGRKEPGYQQAQHRSTTLGLYLVQARRVGRVTLAAMGLLPDTQNCGLSMRRDCRERIPRDRLQRKPLDSDPGMHHGTCVVHMSWCMSGSLTHDDGENVTGIPGTCATLSCAYLVRGQLLGLLSWWPIFESSHYNLYEDQAPVDFICRCQIVSWVVETWLYKRVPWK